MENPSEWKTAELVVDNAYRMWAEQNSLGAIGFSLPHMVCELLRTSGHLKDADEEAVGWDKLREHSATQRRAPSVPGPTTPAPDARRSRTSPGCCDDQATSRRP